MRELTLFTFWPFARGKFSDVVFLIYTDCNSIPAIFSWQLTQENTLNHPAIIQVPGNPLDLAVKPASDDEPPKIIAALDPSDPTKAKSLAIYSLTMTDEKLATSTTALVSDGDVEAAELDVEEKVVKSLLYNTENLRKQSEQEEEQGEAQGSEVMADADVAE